MSNRGWQISEEEAKERDRIALMLFRDVYRREIVEGMPDTVIMFRLARHGYTAREIKNLEAIQTSMECQS